MAHSNNCTSDLNAWVNVFKEFAEAMGMEVDMNKLFGTLYNKATGRRPGLWRTSFLLLFLRRAYDRL